MIKTDARNATLEDIFAQLTSLQAMKLDAVVPSTAIRSIDGLLHIKGMGTKLEALTVDELLSGDADRGVGIFRPTEIFDGQLADKLGIPVKYLRRMREVRPDLYDSNVNGWLHGLDDLGAIDEHGRFAKVYPADARKFFVRTFVESGDDQLDLGVPNVGICRAFLSQGFGGAVDHLDSVVAMLDVLREVDPSAQVIFSNMTERRLFIRIASPQITAAAPMLLRAYRSPIAPRWNPTRDGAAVGDVVAAGCTFSNSEVGTGKLVLAPTFTELSCTNGLTVTKDAFERVHLGARMDEGIIDWSDDTRRANVEVIRNQTRDALKSFFSVDYLERTLAEIDRKAGRELNDPAGTVEIVAKQLSFSEDTARLVLDHFIRGGPTTAGGILQAVTSVAQVVNDADLHFELEQVGLQALDIAYASASA
jgi:hypothetical protein